MTGAAALGVTVQAKIAATCAASTSKAAAGSTLFIPLLFHSTEQKEVVSPVS